MNEFIHLTLDAHKSRAVAQMVAEGIDSDDDYDPSQAALFFKRSLAKKGYALPGAQ